MNTSDKIQPKLKWQFKWQTNLPLQMVEVTELDLASGQKEEHQPTMTHTILHQLKSLSDLAVQMK